MNIHKSQGKNNNLAPKPDITTSREGVGFGQLTWLKLKVACAITITLAVCSGPSSLDICIP
jgi:hypothetical protein